MDSLSIIIIFLSILVVTIAVASFVFLKFYNFNCKVLGGRLKNSDEAISQAMEYFKIKKY